MRQPDKFQHVAVVCVHGINMSQMDYFDPFIERIRKRLPRQQRTFATFRNVFWADIVRGRQKDYIRHAEAMSDLRSSKIRRFVIEGLGDAAAYQKTRLQDSAYYLIQAEIGRVLKELDGETSEPRPLIFIGHSLGCHIVSSYAWDLNKLKHRAHETAKEEDNEVSRKLDPLKDYSPFRRLETFAGFVTLGSNMPLFTFTFGPQRVYPITHSADPSVRPAFPGAALKGRALASARWLNFYSERDVLGYPIKPLNDAYAKEPRIVDIKVRSEGWTLPPWNTIRAHTGYRTNGTVVKETARLIQDLIEAVGEVEVAVTKPGTLSSLTSLGSVRSKGVASAAPSKAAATPVAPAAKMAPVEAKATPPAPPPERPRPVDAPVAAAARPAIATASAAAPVAAAAVAAGAAVAFAEAPAATVPAKPPLVEA